MLMLKVRCRQRESLPFLSGFDLLKHILMIFLLLFGVFLEVHETRQAYRLKLGDELLHLIV